MSKSENQVFDFEKICRLCLGEKRSMSAIFTKKKSDKKVPLPVRIMSCASLELFEGDGMPTSICNKCLVTVNASYAFREQCEQADTTLRRYAAQQQEKEGKVEELDEQPQEQEYEEEDDEEQEDMQQEEAEQGDSEDQTEPSPSTEDANTCGESPTALHFLAETEVSADGRLQIKQEEQSSSDGVGRPEHYDAVWLLNPGQRSADSLDRVADPRSKYRLCSECPKVVLKKNYGRHKLVHSCAMPHMCDVCGRRFKWQRVMEGHKRTHTGEKPFLCNSCGKSFTSSSRLSEHSTVHTGRKAYVCEVCANAFRDKKHLTRHRRTHTGEKPFKCEYCGRAFAMSWNLKEHTRRHTGELPHVCPVCGKGFNRKKGLTEHTKTRHLQGCGDAMATREETDNNEENKHMLFGHDSSALFLSKSAALLHHQNQPLS